MKVTIRRERLGVATTLGSWAVTTIGRQGPAGPQGEQGPSGEGVPAGGATGQVLAKASGADFDTEWVNQSGGAEISDILLIAWAESEAYQATSITRDAEGVLVSAVVVWPDGSGGALTTTATDATWLAVDAYHVTHVLSGKRVRQAAVTRDANGAITAQPALIVEVSP